LFPEAEGSAVALVLVMVAALLAEKYPQVRVSGLGRMYRPDPLYKKNCGCCCLKNNSEEI
jgi:hypothetical protein